jgi:hypothetical protein
MSNYSFRCMAAAQQFAMLGPARRSAFALTHHVRMVPRVLGDDLAQLLGVVRQVPLGTREDVGASDYLQHGVLKGGCHQDHCPFIRAPR